MHTALSLITAYFCIILVTLSNFNLVLAQYRYNPDRGRNPIRGYQPQRLHPCDQSSCYPATGNLLIGREKQLSASSTCGMRDRERYCIVSHLEERKCFWCHSTVPNKPHLSHQISNIVYEYLPGTRQRSWWQSENGKENVTIQLDLEAEFHFTHLIIVFRTFRPAAMLIERSYDFGRTWQVYRYFAQKCEESFPGVPSHTQRHLSDVVCESRYSNVAPSTNGEVIFRVLPPALTIDNPYSQDVQNLLKMTNLRINFTKLHTLGDDLLDNRQEIREKYYYAIHSMVVRGSCSCYGHANRCLPSAGVDPKPDMVHSNCDCTHHTKGRNCEQCEDFFNDLPWKPAIGKQTNACKQCNCNNHANSCHFDAAVYEQSGKVSGGVCDGCRHNTMGTNCEMCKPFFYHDPTKNIQDPEACRPCDCDPSGSLDEGVCDSRTDTYDSQEAGSCHCKTNVHGRRCDSCKNGFWNFTEKNPDGCEQCTCNTLGTIGNQGCNVLTGECTCKRYVTGRDCNQCLPEYWGLSEKRDGCEECDCNKGGSLDNSCDVVTGQCRCRENIQGRKCDKPKQSYYIPALDFYVYEAEVAKVSDNCQIIIREPYRDGRQNSWTGTGFAKAFENSQINFTVDNIKKDMLYDTLIRYEPQVLGDWTEVFITVERLDGPVNPNGPCANWRPEDDRKHVILHESSRYAVSSTPTCFEAGKTYNVIIEFKRKNPSVASPGASILVDSISLIPRGDSVPFMREDEIANIEYDRNRCGEYFYPLHRGDVPEPCKKYFESLSYYVFDSAFPCQCNITGSISKLCSSYGGNCQCKSNVVGRKCDRCAPGTYGFGPEGCKPCDCNGIGSLDNFCDVVTGQCKCRPNTYGRECNQCQPGYWNFPNCQQCQCHGHADVCDPKTGACTTCRDYTTGHYCEQCIDGYYGDPRLGEDIPCRPCPCPETISSGHSFADRCTLDSKTKDVICECLEGYAGTRCDVCADNYYGHPETSGGSCQVCDCSSNVDVTRPGNCDPHTGQCLQCLYNTEGEHCEHCKIGYYGNALEQSCTECVCDILGSKNNSIVNHCDRITGQCPCHKNVVGLKCDECLENHWKIASGNGCEPCNCDSVGSNSKQCNYFDGQCDCKQGFGGLQCNQCETNYWGDPNVECHPCDCDPDGSITQQCHRNNGSCICDVGIGGEKCDVCAHGFLGTAPTCSHCGECFNNWNDILIQRQAQTMAVIDKARNIKKIGATGAYTKEFDEMEHQLDEVRDLLNNSKISTGDLDEINSTLSDLFDKQKQVESYAISVDAKRSNVSTEILISNVSLDKLQKQSEELKNRATELKNKATDLQEANVDEALRITLNARNVVRESEDRALDSKDIVEEADRQCRAAESIVARTKNDSKFEWNDEQLDMLQDELNGLKSNISLLNEHMCARRGDPCDSLCGGAGCGTCGGVSCEEGAVEKVKKALTLTQEASAEIKNKEAKAEELLRTLSQAHLKTKEAHDEAQKTFDKALSINNTVGDQLLKTQSTIKKLQESLNSSYGKPEDVQKLAKDTLDKKILLDPAEITDLAQRINQTVTSLTDIDKILKATAADLNRANNLENRAIQTRDDAKKILDTTSNVTAALTEADSAQSKAEEAIGKANDDIAKAEKDLKEIASETKEAQVKANDTVTYVNEYRNRLRILQTNFLKNERGAKEIDRKASNVLKDAEKARSDAEYLQTKYSQTNSSLSEKAEKSLGIRDRAQGLLLKASKLTVNLTDKLNFLSGLSNESNNQEQKLKELAQIIEELNASMDNYLLNIRDRSAFYRSCT